MTKPSRITPTVNFLVRPKSSSNPFSKTLQLLFLFFQIVFALDLGFIKFERINRNVVKLFTFFQASILLACMIYSMLFQYDTSYSFWYFYDVFMYYLYSISVLLSKSTYYDFLADLHMFDKEINSDSNSYKLEHKILLTFLINMTLKFIVSIYLCAVKHSCVFPYYISFFYYITLLGENVVFIIFSFLFRSVHYRIKKLCSFVKNDRSDVVTCQYLYKSIVEITEKAKKSFDLAMVLSLTGNTCDLILTMYAPFANNTVKLNLPIDTALSVALVIQELALLFGPPITAGLLSSQVEALRLVLYDKLVKVSDPKHTKDIKRFINYIDVRPMRFKVYSVIPLDWRLPVIVINVSVTYLIVMIQFTAKT